MQSLWMVLAALLFSVMGVCVKLASDSFSIWEIVFYRGVVGVILLMGMALLRPSVNHPGTDGAPAKKFGSVRIQGFVASLATSRPGMHIRRSISGTLALTLWFFSIAHLPIATAVSLNYTAPLYVGVYMAWRNWQNGRRLDVGMLTVLALGFVGVILLLKPTLGRDQLFWGVLGFLSAGLSAIAYLSVKALGQIGEPESRIVFYFVLLNSAAGLSGSVLTGFHAIHPHGLALLLGVGIPATVAQLAMTRAYSSGRTLLTANLTFLGIVFSSLFGVLLFGDTIQPGSLMGMGVIIFSGILATWLTARKPATPELNSTQPSLESA